MYTSFINIHYINAFRFINLCIFILIILFILLLYLLFIYIYALFIIYKLIFIFIIHSYIKLHIYIHSCILYDIYISLFTFLKKRAGQFTWPRAKSCLFHFTPADFGFINNQIYILNDLFFFL